MGSDAGLGRGRDAGRERGIRGGASRGPRHSVRGNETEMNVLRLTSRDWYEEEEEDDGTVVLPATVRNEIAFDGRSEPVLLRSRLVPREARDALASVGHSREWYADGYNSSRCLDRWSLANFTDEVLYFWAGVWLTRLKLTAMKESCECDVCGQCLDRLSIENGTKRLTVEEVTRADTQDWSGLFQTLTSNAPDLDAERLRMLCHERRWHAERMREVAPRLEPYLRPRSLITEAALQLEDRLRHESEASARREKLDESRL